MLFPNLRVAGRGRKRIEILRPERAQFDEISLQGGLKIKIHGPSQGESSTGLAVAVNQLRAHCFEFNIAQRFRGAQAASLQRSAACRRNYVRPNTAGKLFALPEKINGHDARWPHSQDGSATSFSTGRRRGAAKRTGLPGYQ